MDQMLQPSNPQVSAHSQLLSNERHGRRVCSHTHPNKGHTGSGPSGSLSAGRGGGEWDHSEVAEAAIQDTWRLTSWGEGGEEGETPREEEEVQEV